MKNYLLFYFLLLLCSFSHAQKYKVEYLGPGVNTDNHSEASPVISADGKTLYFSRLMDTNTWDDMYYSELQADGTWSTAKPIVELNTDLRDCPLHLSADGNTLIYLTESDELAKNPRDGIYKTQRTPTGWSKPERIKFEYDIPSYESSVPAFSLDMKIMILTIDGDLYVSFIKNDNTWSYPSPLSPMINIAREFTPFIATDNKTLYYSGSRADTYGRNDIYKTTRLDDTWHNWSTPINLGNTVNSAEWESYYRINAQGDYAYFYDGGRTTAAVTGDIVRVPILEQNKPEPVVLIKGKVYNSKTKLPIQASIQYEALPQGNNAGSVNTNPADGSYSIILPYGVHYGYHAKAAGYISVSENLNLDTIKSYREIQQDLVLTPIEIGASIKLNNVFFVQSKAELLPSSSPELDRLAKILLENPTIIIELQGHTDNTGNPDLNLKLSEDRVKVVKEYLVAKGVKADRISGKGFGGTKPVASNTSEATKKLNRRVEFVILKM